MKTALSTTVSLFLCAMSMNGQELKGIVLVGREADLIQEQEKLQEINGLIVSGIELPGNPADLEREIFDLENKEPSLSFFKQVEEIIYRHYLENDRPFILVDIPSQDLSGNVAQFVIQESVIDQIKVVGNKWSCSEQLEAQLGLELGEPICQSDLIQKLNFINRNPFRRVDIVYGAGERDNTTNIDILVSERSPYRVYAGTDNTGTRFTRRERAFAGFNWGNAFGLGHIFSCQYTASYHVRKFQAVTAQYLALAPWGHSINLYGGYSSVHASLSFPSQKNHGESYQGSFRYLIPKNVSETTEHDLIFGFDFKGLNNTLEFVEFFPVFSNLVNISQIMMGYEFHLRGAKITTELKAQLFCSPGEIFPNQSNRQFEQLRPGARNNWVYGTLSFQQTYKLPLSFSLFFSAEGQLSSQSLLPIEQMGIGGYSTVRGYEERELNADSGAILNLEARTPPLSFITRIKKQNTKDAFQFVGFLDFGYAQEHTSIPGIKKHDYLLGIGSGVRYTLDPYVAARFDWGIKLHNEAFFAGGSNMIHFSVIASY